MKKSIQFVSLLLFFFAACNNSNNLNPEDIDISNISEPCDFVAAAYKLLIIKNELTQNGNLLKEQLDIESKVKFDMVELKIGTINKTIKDLKSKEFLVSMAACDNFLECDKLTAKYRQNHGKAIDRRDSIAVAKLMNGGNTASNSNSIVNNESNNQVSSTDETIVLSHSDIKSEGTFIVDVDKCYFYSKPDENFQKKSYLVKGQNATFSDLDNQNKFVFARYENEQGRITEGWIKVSEILID